MPTAAATFDTVFALARQLRPSDQARLIASLAPTLEHLLDRIEQPIAVPERSPLRGLLTDLGSAPSDADIMEVQQEMWNPRKAEPLAGSTEWEWFYRAV